MEPLEWIALGGMALKAMNDHNKNQIKAQKAAKSPSP